MPKLETTRLFLDTTIPNFVVADRGEMSDVTMESVNTVNASFGYPQVHIVTPREAVGHHSILTI